MDKSPSTIPDNVSASATQIQPMRHRACRILVTAALSFGISILLTIVLLAKVGMMRNVVFAMQGLDNGWGIAFSWFALLVVMALPLAVLVYGFRHRWLTWRVLGAAWALVIGSMIYLGQDEPVLNLPADLDEFAPVMAGDAAGYQLISRYSKTKPDFKLDDKLIPILGNLSGNETDTDVLRKHRDEIEAGWIRITVLGDWFAEMSAMPRLGDLTRKPSDPNGAKLGTAGASDLTANKRDNVVICRLLSE